MHTYILNTYMQILYINICIYRHIYINTDIYTHIHAYLYISILHGDFWPLCLFKGHLNEYNFFQVIHNVSASPFSFPDAIAT